MPGSRSAGLDRFARTMLFGAAGLAVALFLVTSLARMGHPFELEWMEGTVLAHVRRALAGSPLYVAPTLAFVPLGYTPLYYHASAAAALLVGPTFLAPRLVSWLATVAAFVAIHRLVRHETRSRTAAFAAVGVFAALYWRSGTWFDVARPDLLALALGLAGVAVLRRRGDSAPAVVAASALFAAAVLTKQSMAVALAPLVLWKTLTTPRRGLLLAALCALFAGGAALAWNLRTGGWFRYYVVDVALARGSSPELLWRFPLKDIGVRLLPLLAIVAYAVARPVTRPRSDALGFHAALLLGFVGSAWHLRTHVGSFPNVSVPAFAALAIVTGVAVRQVRVRVKSSAVRAAVAALLALQILVLLRDPRPFVPTSRDREAGARLVARMRALPGRVYVSSHAYLAERAGKPGHADVVPLTDVFEEKRRPTSFRLRRMLRDSLAAQVFDAAVLDGGDWLRDDFLRGGYEPRARLLEDDAFWPVTGRRTRPEILVLPRRTRDSPRER